MNKSKKAKDNAVSTMTEIYIHCSQELGSEARELAVRSGL